MSFDRKDMELLEALRKKLDLVQAFWYFVEHGADGFDCPLAQNAMNKFEVRDFGEVLSLLETINRRSYGIKRNSSPGSSEKVD